jgi:hypothetical protein
LEQKLWNAAFSQTKPAQFGGQQQWQGAHHNDQKELKHLHLHEQIEHKEYACPEGKLWWSYLQVGLASPMKSQAGLIT